jgi:hypothetical protein
MWAAGAAIVVCLALGGVPAAAQEASSSPAPSAAPVVGPAVVSGTVTYVVQESAGTSTEVEGVDQQLGLVFRNVWDVDDARLDGDVTYNGNWYSAPLQVDSTPVRMQIESSTYELTNPGGGWLGTATACCAVGPVGIDTVVLTGVGGYEGLTAYLVLDWTKWPPLIHGVIFPGPMPPTPSPAPAASPLP